MSILETFYILFKSDTKEVKKGAEETKRYSEDISKSLDKVNTGANRVGDSFVGMGRSIAGAAAALLSVGAILGNIKESYHYALELDQSSKSLNLNIQTLDAWGRAVEKNGGTAQGFQQSIKSLAQNLNIRNQDAVQMLPMLADSFSKVGKDRSMRFGQKLGLDQSTIMLLQQGRREVEAVINRQKELGTVTERDAEVAGKFNSAWSDMTYAFRIMWLQVATTVLPVFEKIVNGFTEMAKYLQKHSNAVIGTLLALGAAALIFAAPFIAANATIILITAGIVALSAAIGILIEDIIAFSNGSSSFIGDVLNKWPEVGNVIKGVFYGIRDSIKSVIELLGFLFDGFNKLNSFGLKVESKIKNSVLGFVKGATTPPAPGEKPVFDFIKEGMEDISSSPIMAQTSNSISNSVSNGGNKNASITTGPITINTQATDGEQVGNALSRGLRDQLRQATGTFDDGVLA